MGAHWFLAMALQHIVPCSAPNVPDRAWLELVAASGDGEDERPAAAAGDAAPDRAPARTERVAPRTARARPPVERLAAVAPSVPAVDEAAQSSEAVSVAAPPSSDPAAPSVGDPGGLVGSAPGGAGDGQDGHAADEGRLVGASAGGAALSRMPHLIVAGASPCASYFPSSADVSRGRVRIRVHVDPHGHADRGRVLAERPLRQGFGRAALACATQLRFEPALDGHGLPVDGDASLQIEFARL